jgi:hypothetical protein
MECELTQDIRVCPGTLRALFNENLNVSDCIQFTVAGQDLTANVDTGVVAALLYKKVQNHTITFKDEMAVVVPWGAQLRNGFRP